MLSRKWASLWDGLLLIKRGMSMIHTLEPSYFKLSAVQSVISASQPLITLYMSALILNELAGTCNINTLVILVLFTVGISFLFSVLRAVISRNLSIIQNKIWQRVQMLCSERCCSLDYEYMEQTLLAELTQYIDANMKATGGGFLRLFWLLPSAYQSLVSTIISCVMLAGIFVSMGEYKRSLITSPLASIILVIIILISIISISKLSLYYQNKRINILKSLPKANTLLGYYNNYIKVNQAGKDIRLYSQSEAIMSIIRNRYGGIEFNIKEDKYASRSGGFTAAINSIAGGVAYIFVGLRALAGMYSIGSIVQYVGAITSIIGSLTSLTSVCALIWANNEHFKTIYEFFDLPDIKYKGTLTIEKRNDRAYEIEFHDVSFKYPNSDVYALRNFSIKIGAGEKLAVVGVNGSGKTTMIKLLCRLYDPDEGYITLNGIDIKKYKYDEYLNLFSIVFQDFRLLSFSLGQNIASAMEYDDELVNEALDKVGYGERFNRMAKGLHTPLYKNYDEEGVEISGGEAQKIALARAIYKKAPFIILDEPTAALDPIAEYEIYKKFNEITNKNTTIYISHRLSSCRFCDNIAVLDAGILVQYGSHDKLIADKAGKYYELWHAQAQYYE